jgi:hypothetical protein
VATQAPSYRQHRSPAEIIAHGVRLYRRFPLSHRGAAAPRPVAATVFLGAAGYCQVEMPGCGLERDGPAQFPARRKE